MKRRMFGLAWREITWQRPFELDAVHELLTHLAAMTPRGPVIWEARGVRGQVRYFIGSENQYKKKLDEVFRTHGDTRFSDLPEGGRAEAAIARQLKISRPILSLKTDMTLAVIRAGLAAMLDSKNSEQTVLQIVLGPAYAPAPMPNRMPDPHANWLDVISGNVGPASPESRNAIREKTAHHGFHCCIRVGASGGKVSGSAHIWGILSALKTLESAGVRITAADEKTAWLNEAHVPWHFPLRLSVKELAAFFLLPVGAEELPGAAGLHPKPLLPPAWYRNPDPAHSRVFASGVGAAEKTKLSVSPQDSLEHTVILGPTGSGKSTAMLNLIMADINAGRSVLVIDPKSDLVNNVLTLVPESRDDDVVVIDPTDPCPAGFNPLNAKNSTNPNLIADAALAVLKEVFSENWGIRSQDVLTAALLTLAQIPDASLLWIPALLTDEGFRRKITANIQDKIGLEPFWSGFEAMKDSQRQQEIAPVLNKMRQFLLRPGLRNVFGQAQPKFSLTDLFNKNRILLVPLNRGVIGAESARLLGSMIVGITWTLALSRASEPPERRRIVSVFIDELQDYLTLPTDLSDALAQARGLGVGLTLAHQYREQLPPNIRAGVDANARNKIVFGLNAGDAKDMAAMAPELTPLDFMALPRYQVYATLQSGGKSTGWVSGSALPQPKPVRAAAELKKMSAARYGKPAGETEREYLALLGHGNTGTDFSGGEPDAPAEVIGRRKRQ
jgi:energy-coupling factor transporter ATP-binding protein EcfA2